MTALRTLQSLLGKNYHFKKSKSRSSRYPATSYRRLSVGFEPLENRRLLSITIDANWLSGKTAPYILGSANETYTLAQDITVDGTAFVFGGKNITLDLGGHTITYGNSTPVNVTNGGFETGSGPTVPGWDLTHAPHAAIAANTDPSRRNRLLLGQSDI